MNPEITQILQRHNSGDSEAMGNVIEAAYAELKLIARRRLFSSRGDRTLNTTSLVNEAYLKLASGEKRLWQNRAHFFAVAATAMRQIVIDDARRKMAGKRQGHKSDEDVEAAAVDRSRIDELMMIDEALNVLAVSLPREATVFECRYFIGMSTQETADALGVPVRTVERRWSEGKKMMRKLMQPGSQA